MGKLFAVALVLLAARGVSAEPAVSAASAPLRVTLSAGAALPGFVDASWGVDFPEAQTVRFRTSVCPLAKVAVDYYLIPRLGPSLSLHYAPLIFPEELDLAAFYASGVVIPRVGVHFLEVEAGIKARAVEALGMLFDTGVYLGFGQTLSAVAAARDSGLILDLVADIRLPRMRPELVLTVGFFAQLYGGVEGVAWIRSYPLFYGTVGIGVP
jgi:hypothetical protein